MLFPIDWEEPFGLVMMEAMACGAPIIATRRGAVPEVIDDGLTGIVVDDWRDMAAALDRAEAIDPEQQRRIVEERFSPARMVADYEDAFEAAMAAWAGGGPAASLAQRARRPPSPDKSLRSSRFARGSDVTRRQMSDAILFDRDRVDHLDSLTDRPRRLRGSMLLWVDLHRGSEYQCRRGGRSVRPRRSDPSIAREPA